MPKTTKPQKKVAQVELEDVPTEPNTTGKPVVNDKSFELVKNVKVPVSVKLGDGSICVDELFALKNGSVVALHQAVDTPLQVMLDGQVVAEGELVVVDDHFGIKVTRVAANQ